MTDFIKDPALYRRMGEPHVSHEEANKASTAFFADLKALREKHRIRDIVCSLQVAFVGPDGETVGQSTLTIGSSIEAVGMAAITYGELRSDLAESLDRYASRQTSRRRA